ncbi:MAG: eukaryotic-like serine/threonine-protein kinase [Myxococcales bacterium]|nr:eukaryotic-like serine/threonine-protein kinase [Myxococcales bacterium]
MPEPVIPVTLDASMLATMSDVEVARTLRMNLASFEDVAQTIAQNPNSTIEPAHRASSDTQGRRALEGLGARRDDRGITSGLDMERTIGEGGMGIVRLATQRSLGRKVAVKTLRPDVKSEAATLRLLREAWVTGTLEHPNIVPVYDLGLGEDGSPIIVLKRIEGVEWGEVMQDAAVAKERYGAADLLEHNLRILVQLCNAVSLAHARGVLHRDLKPENVMIGSFGEVYLVDWGIAVSLRPDPLGRLPLAAEQSEMAGTPCYMAPEMLGALGQLSERTDVYLLGAILHEILTKKPPHNGSFKQIVGSILMSSFVYDADAPRELAEIAQRAMQRQPDDRFASAEELRLRLEWYLRHRGSLAISEEASRRLDDMQRLVESDASADSVHDQLYHLFTEVRFGFRQALKESPDNETARLGLRRAIETVVRFELDRGAAEAAAGALAELQDPPADLVARVSQALEARAAEKKKMMRLEQLDAQHDLSTGRRTRVTATTVLGVLWTITPQIVGHLEHRYPDYPDWAMYAWTGGVTFLGWLVVLWGRESLTKTVVNRRILATGMIAFAGQLALEVGGHVLGIPRAGITTLHMLVWGTACALAASVEPRFWYSVATFYAAFLLACRWPERRWDLMSLSTALLVYTFLRSWWRPAEDRPRIVIRLQAERRAREKDAKRNVR